MQLHGVVTLETDQRVDVRIKCHSLFLINYSKDTSISAFQVDGKDLRLPGLHWRYSVTPSYYSYYSYSNTSKLIPYNYRPTQRDTKSYTMYTNYKRSTKTANTSRTGIYFVSLTGELDDKTQSSFVFSTDPSSTSCLYSSPIHFKKSNNLMKSVSASGLVFLNKGVDFALIKLPTSYHRHYSYYHYYYTHNSDVYLSLQYMGDLQTTSGFSSTLNQSVHVRKGVNFELPHTKWHSDSTCGKFATADLPMTFGRYRTLYSGVHIVTFNLRLNYSGGCHVSVCYVINGRYLHSFDRQSCFEQHMNDTSSKVTTSTFSGSELLYMNEGEQVSLKLNNTCQATILKRSSLSSFYLGTKDVQFGFSSVIGTSKATLSALPSTSYPYHSSYYYHNYNDISTTYDVRGWTTNVKNSKMFFKRGVTYLLNEMFVCSKTGAYLIFVKLHAKSAVKGLKQSDGCIVSAQLAVDSSNTQVGVQQAFFGAANTLAFSTTIMLRKWQGLSVRFTQKTEQCGKMEIGESSSFAAVYLGRSMICLVKFLIKDKDWS